MVKRNAFTWVELLVVIAIIGVLLALLLPATSSSREDGRCKQCVARMEKLGIALRQYHDVHGTFPPAYTTDDDGNSLQSWRALISPYLRPEEGEKPLDDIRLEESWNSEDNSPFHENMPRTFQCPSAVSHRNTTVYKMLTGEKTAGGTSMSTWKRKPSEVVLLIEAWPSVPWMCPNDFPLEDFQTAIYPKDLEKSDKENGVITFEDRNPDKKPVIGARHFRDFYVLFADGQVKTYRNWTFPIKELEALCRTE